MLSKGSMEVENLDTMNEDELLILQDAYSKLSKYAEQKRFAMKLRKDGRITAALAYEHQCDLIYKRLPAEFQW